ncbi:hypothetical protein E2C01_094741 [Portunus trituberculatus]|uniref:Uncharacterized protein n=1 Tax=Portunus trituberculatus TaxID=210409 RepID=A0A5B7K3Z6_PORTR|nr:hypothetical protein [Portunus trituberculatus]
MGEADKEQGPRMKRTEDKAKRAVRYDEDQEHVNHYHFSAVLREVAKHNALTREGRLITVYTSQGTTDRLLRPVQAQLSRC